MIINMTLVSTLVMEVLESSTVDLDADLWAKKTSQTKNMAHVTVEHPSLLLVLVCFCVDVPADPLHQPILVFGHCRAHAHVGV